MCSGGCVATCFCFYLIVGFVEGSATRCDWPSARRVAPRSRWRETKRKEKVNHALLCFSPPPDKQQQGGGGRWGREGGHPRVASLHLRHLQHSQTRRSSSGRTAASKPEKKKKCFCKTIQEKKKLSCLRKKSKVRTNNENNEKKKVPAFGFRRRSHRLIIESLSYFFLPIQRVQLASVAIG